MQAAQLLGATGCISVSGLKAAAFVAPPLSEDTDEALTDLHS